MAAPCSPEESKRRFAAIEKTKTPRQPNGSITQAAQDLGMSPSALSRWHLNHGRKVIRVPRFSKEECIAEFRRVSKQLGRIPRRDDWRNIEPIGIAWRSHFPSYDEFIKASKIYTDDPRILLLDIETAPNIAYVWGTYKQNINPDFIAANGYVMCWTAKWLGKPEVFFKRLHKGKPLEMLRPIHKLLNEAHAVIHYNGKKFDIPTLNKEFLTHGLPPPSPYKQIDCLRTMWDTFLFPSNKLDYISKTLGIGEKVRHKGAQLWLDCMADKPDAWDEMEMYNRQDVVLLEKLYMMLRPWIRNHPNLSALADDSVCPTCGSDQFRRDGQHLAQLLKYERYQCASCDTWFRGTKSISWKKTSRFKLAA